MTVFFSFFWFWLDRENRRKWIDVELKACTLPNSWKTIRIRTVFFLVRQLWQAGFEGFKLMVQNERTATAEQFQVVFSLGLPLGWASSCGWYFCLKLIFPIKKKEMGRMGVDGQRGFGSWCMNFFSPVKQPWLAGKMDLLTGQFASNLQSLVRITDCALTVCCFWWWTD